MFSILKKELHTYFSSPIAYIIITVFLTLNGLFLWIIPGQYNILESGYANVDGLFYITPWLFLFLCPAITMSLFAEEKQLGTWELLITKPLNHWSIVFGKFLAGWILVLIALIPTIIYYFSVWYIAEPIGNIDSGAFWGSFIGLILLSAVFVAIGTFSSTLSNNQIISFVVAILISFFMFYGFELISSLISKASIGQVIEQIGINSHYKSISRGVLESKDISYFSLISLVFIYITRLKIKIN
jgi:ABC-2 type transport system permease protein